MEFSPDGEWLASAGGADEVARIWAAQHRDECVWARPAQPFEPRVCRFSEDGTKLLVHAKTGILSIWHSDGTPTNREVSADHPTAALLAADGLLIVAHPEGLTATRGNAIAQQKLSDIVDIAFLRPQQGARSLVVLTAGLFGAKRLEIRNAMTLARLNHVELQITPTSVATSHDGQHIAVGSADGHVMILDSNLVTQNATRPHAEQIGAVAFSPSDAHIIVGSWDSTATVLNIRGEPEARLVGAHDSYIEAVGFSPNGRHVLTVDRSHAAQGAVWDWRGEYVIKRLNGHSHSALCGAVSPTSAQAVTAGMDSTVRMWDLEPTLDAFLRSKEMASFTDEQLGITIDSGAMVAAPRRPPD